ncbi:MAG: putative rane protein [Gemmatimonadetes bacterium]|nr:putative rane protein [Gemmatimonadota bacterium]
MTGTLIFNLLAAALTVATGPAAGADSVLRQAPAPRPMAASAPLLNRGDTLHKRVRAVEVSDSYATRLAIHQWVAYATIPVFGLQWVAGQQVWNKGANAPSWARNGHRVGASLLAGMFTVNTVTGGWNWWESRNQPQGRTKRNLHALAMLTADAAFTYAGAVLSNRAETDANARSQHRTIALSAMALTTVSGLAMKLSSH